MNKPKALLHLKPTNLYDEAGRRYNELLVIRQQLQKDLTRYPPGKIHISNSSNRTQYYLRRDNVERSGEYISKNDNAKLKAYIQKSYDEKVLKHVDREIHVLEVFLKKSGRIVDDIRKQYSGIPAEAKQFIEPIDTTDEDYRMAWENKPYVGKQITDYVTLYETDRKERVRSKSELNIANALAVRGIPYKYECPLVLKDGSTIHPDFTVLNVRERKVYYWEHRGMMDDKDYAKKSVSRIKEYMKNSIFIGCNLIITEETSTAPLGTNEITAMIDRFFV
ncbi:MAG: hypothetical protein J5589_02830, partial [Firmicutes bacterium]|nr:hypothetical protein [Bacillota bacterium]